MLVLFVALALAEPLGPPLDDAASPPDPLVASAQQEGGDAAPTGGASTAASVSKPVEVAPEVVAVPSPDFERFAEATGEPIDHEPVAAPVAAESSAAPSLTPASPSMLQMASAFVAAVLSWMLGQVLKRVGDKSEQGLLIRRALPLVTPFAGAAVTAAAELLAGGDDPWKAALWGLVAGAMAVWGQEAKSATLGGDVKVPGHATFRTAKPPR